MRSPGAVSASPFPGRFTAAPGSFLPSLGSEAVEQATAVLPGVPVDPHGEGSLSPLDGEIPDGGDVEQVGAEVTTQGF